MDRSVLGYILLLAGAVAWLLFTLVDGPGGYSVDLVLATVGFALAAWAARADRPRIVAAGLAIAVLGFVLFYDGDFLGGDAGKVGAVFAAGLAVAAVGTFLGRATVVAVGMWASAIAGVLWVFVDGVEGMGWQPGNVLAAAGAALVALGARE